METRASVAVGLPVAVVGRTRVGGLHAGRRRRHLMATAPPVSSIPHPVQRTLLRRAPPLRRNGDWEGIQQSK